MVIKYATNSEGKITKIFDTVMNTEGVSVLTKENIGDARVVLFDNTPNAMKKVKQVLENSSI